MAVLSWPILERIPIVGDLAVSPHGIGIGRYLALTGSQWAVLATLVALTAWLVLRRPWERSERAWHPPFTPPPIGEPTDRGEPVDARP